MVRSLALCIAAVALTVAPPPAFAQDADGGSVFVFGETVYDSASMAEGGGGTFRFGTSVYAEAPVDGEPLDDVCVELGGAIEVEGALAAVTEGDVVSVGTAESADACAAGGGHWMGTTVQVCDAGIEVVVGDGPARAVPGCLTVQRDADLQPIDGFVIIDNIEG